MKQLLQSVSKGEALVADVPAPLAGPGEVLVAVRASLVSAGTERTAVEFAEKNLVGKAMARPDLVRQVVNKAKREGVLATWDTVRTRLDSDMALGYSNAGVVIALGEGVSDLSVGDPVACAGYGYASHAEVVRVPRNLVARIPAADSQVAFEAAAFTTVGAIALQGVRLSEAKLGDVVAVVGLGLIGLITVQLLKAAGCQVIGMDPSSARCDLARSVGCDATATSDHEFASLVAGRSAGFGADSVLITAATSSNGPVELAGEIARERAIVVAVGAVGMNIPRKPFYEKELDFRISRSYGPGRYDPGYEEGGRDYPIGYVRWTENRNMQAFLQMLADRSVKLEPLITHRFPIEDAVRAYDLISGKTGEPFLGVVITYPEQVNTAREVKLAPARANAAPMGVVRLGVVGAGLFARGTLLPAIKKVPGIELISVCAATGVSARGMATRLGFRACTTDYRELLSNAEVNTVVIATRHSQHAEQVIASLEAGKHVFCEKPLCLNEDELAAIADAHARSGRELLVGFNRRFSPMAIELHKFFAAASEPLVMNYRINAGVIPGTHWVQDPNVGGGRVIGEVCHFVDLLSYVCGSEVRDVFVAATPSAGRFHDDNLVATLRFANGSVASIVYAAGGDKSQSKERVEVYGADGVGVLDDFRALTLSRSGRSRTLRSRLRQDKGHAAEWQAFAAALREGKGSPIPFSSLVNTTLATFAMIESLRTHAPVAVPGAGGE